MSEQPTDTPQPDEPKAGSGTALAEGGEEAPFKMSLSVDIQNAGPCKKHVRVQVPRNDLDHYYNEAVKDLVTTAAVPGFRTGHVPRKLVEKRFRKEVGDQVRQKVLLQSLQQLGEDYKLDAINEPDLDVENLVLPEEGDFSYEFDIEVRPEFDLPDYRGLSIQRPVRAITEGEVQAYLENYLSQFGQLVPHDGPAEAGDFVLATLRFESNGAELSHSGERQIRIRPKLRFTDSEVTGFDRLMEGVRPGDKRETTSKISIEASKVELRGEPVTIYFEINDVKRLRLPELNQEFLDQLGVASEAVLRQEVRETLERQVTYEQRQSTRRQVLEKITASADWDLPESMVKRQVENALRREILEMQQAGFTDEQIRARQNELMQRQISMTRQALKEHFVLDKIATQEKLEVTPHDKEVEISFMAMQRGESPRKVRARLEKMGLIENLEAQILERKAVDVVLEKSVFQDVPGESGTQDDVEALELSVCGQEVAPAPPSADTGAKQAAK
jgi:trigger factor